MNIRYIIAYLVLLTLLALKTNGQQIIKKDSKQLIPGVENLKVGDIVPDIVIKKIINDSVNSAKISDFKSQLLILDFWDTNCASCIELFPKLNALQQHFGSKIKILPVTWQNEKVVDVFFKTNRFLKAQNPPIKLPCVVEDKILASYFKHEIISHEVWIYKGVVKAITLPQYVSIENIQMILDGKKNDLPIKNDAIGFDLTKPFINFAGSLYNTDSNSFSYSVVTGYLEGLRKSGDLNYLNDPIKNTSRIALFNRDIINVFQLLLHYTDSIPRNIRFTGNRLILETKDPSKYVYNEKFVERDLWNRKNKICYEMVVKNRIPPEKMAQLAVKDLSNKLGLQVLMDKRKINCLVIVKSQKDLKSNITFEKPYKTSISNIIFSLDYSGKYPPVINETNYSEQFYLERPYNTLSELKIELKKIGFDIVESQRDLDVLVIKEF